MKRSFKEYALITLKGMAMGSADVVPGVSGGTIAFITGIYEELIASLNSLSLSLFKDLKNDGIKAVWNKVNGNFLVALFTGVLISIFSLAKGINYLLDNSPILVWSFFFGLIIASIWLMIKQVEKWNIGSIIGIIAGTVLVYYISTIQSTTNADSLWYILLSGMVAICAMILPGISGSFILLLMGAYQVVISAVSDMEIKILSVFATGCIIGLLAFSKLLNYLFKNFKNVTIATLTGFLIGSLYKVWPWKVTNSVFVKHAGEVNEEIVAIGQTNVLPGDYTVPMIKSGNVIGQLPGEPQLVFGTLLMIFGIILLIGLEKLGSRNKSKA